MAAIPAVVALLSLGLPGRAHPTARRAARSSAPCAGIALLAVAAPAPAPAASTLAAGYALLVGAVLCEASYVVIGKQLTGSVSPRRISALDQPVGAGPGHALRASGRRCASTSAPSPSARGGCWCSTRWPPAWWTVWLWMNGLRQVPASQAGRLHRAAADQRCGDRRAGSRRAFRRLACGSLRAGPGRPAAGSVAAGAAPGRRRNPVKQMVQGLLRATRRDILRL